jgi:protein-S-isoprenylcysteine O-methyltransferase Ste14
MTASRARQLTENLIIAIAYLYFADAHFAIIRGGSPQWYIVAPMVVQETILAAMFVCRRPSQATSPRVVDWVVGIAGSFAPLLVRPTNDGNVIGTILQMVGLTIALAALLSLRRSMGIVAANRGVVTGGVYRFVRHPMYLGHIICLAGYFISYTTAYNTAAIVVTYWAIVCRMDAEEKWLRNSIPYRRYMERAKWRLVPCVY